MRTIVRSISILLAGFAFGLACDCLGIGFPVEPPLAPGEVHAAFFPTPTPYVPTPLPTETPTTVWTPLPTATAFTYQTPTPVPTATPQTLASRSFVVTGTAHTVTTTVYFPISGWANVQGNATEGNVQDRANAAFTMSDLSCSLSAGPGGAGKSYTLTVRKAAVNTTITCQIATNATTCSDHSHTNTVAAGDLLSLGSVTAGTPTASLVLICSLSLSI